MRIEQPVTIAGLRFRLILESADVHSHVYLTAHADWMKRVLEDLEFGAVPVAEGNEVWAPSESLRRELLRGQCPSCLRMEVFGHAADCSRLRPEEEHR